MRLSALALGVSLGLASLSLACGQVATPATDAAPIDGGDVDASAPVSAICERAPSCAEARAVRSLDDLREVFGLCSGWGNAEIDSALKRTATLRVETGFRVCPSDFALPDDCASGEPLCNAGVAIEVDPTLAGVVATAACDGAQLEAGARFRVRYDVLPANRFNQFRTARVRFERACDAACTADERRCSANQACYPASTACFACGQGTREQCACRSADNGVVPECTACEVFYDDFIVTGRCVGGACAQESSCP